MRGIATPFPKTYREIPTQQLIEVYQLGPERVRAAVEGLTLEELRSRPRPGGGWSALEIALHVTDSEVFGTTRLRLVRTHPGAQLPGYNQDILTRTSKYQAANETDLEEALDLLAALRTANRRFFGLVATEDWNKHGHHPEYGPVTLRNLLELYADHGERHIDQIREIRRLLGRPLELPALLEMRLY